MNYKYIKNSIDKESLILPKSDKINPFLLKNNEKSIIEALNFLNTKDKYLYIHGFMGCGKRQFINYITDFTNDDVIKLEYYCKESTVYDDILLNFINEIEKLSISKAANINSKIITLNSKFLQLISSIKKPFLIILHSLDDIAQENSELINENLPKILEKDNVKIIISTRSLQPTILNNINEDKKITLRPLSKEIFNEYILSNDIKNTEKSIEDFYNLTRGYYYHTALAIKIMQAMKINLNEFIQKNKQAGTDFDTFLGITYINLIPTAIRNFFWFLRTIRHGMTMNALAVYDVYDEFALNYLKNNLMTFESNETVYVQDYFLQKIDISIPQKTQIKLHKYIINIYEKELKESLQKRSMLISRQAMRAEIEYHNKCISEIENKTVTENIQATSNNEKIPNNTSKATNITDKINDVRILINDKNWTKAIEAFLDILKNENIDLISLIEIRKNLAELYKNINDYKKAAHYYELVETYYKQHEEYINLNYLYYEITDLYYKMYKNERAIETIKKVIYSVDTPQSLMVNACTLLGNIYSDINNPNEAYNYYKKALDSLNEDVEDNILAELYFKYALANDDMNKTDVAFEYYNKCITINSQNEYKALAYSNLASCYYENENYEEAEHCYIKALNIDKLNNNYDGIYYNSSHVAKIYLKLKPQKALDYLIEAKRSADFLNEDFYMIEASLALGDYYYNNSQTFSEALNEYFKALKYTEKSSQNFDISKIKKRIDDMKLRLPIEVFEKIEKKYE